MASASIQRKLYEYLVEKIDYQIVNGGFNPGEPLSSIDSLRNTYAPNRGVLREVTKVLAQQAFLPYQLAMLDPIQRIDPVAANTAYLAMFDQAWTYFLSSNKGSP